jgi:TrmH family RNA methyltransferase
MIEATRGRKMADDLAPEEVRAMRVDVPRLLGNIRVVLEETKDARNIGSTARAMKGMGIRDLRLVNPLCDWRGSEEARRLATNSTDVLDGAAEVGTLDEAIADVHFLVGTTHRRRERRMAQPVTIRDAACEIARLATDHRVALCFGREDFGLSNDFLSRCNLVASVPMATKNPSLNLSQAVQIVVYEVFAASLSNPSPVDYRLAGKRDVEALMYRLKRVLRMIEFQPLNDDWNTIRVPVERVLNRARFETRDIRVVTLFLHDIEEFLKRRVPELRDFADTSCDESDEL